ncbi:hypothetical protein ACOQFO_01270 [Ureibacillus sp. MALMAid1270]|uniref:hypothetical protein n=1 Tax=Ureibacillus sp. MALMAid1270 TaxID=3411629 RepID=UPI003BA82AD8
MSNETFWDILYKISIILAIVGDVQILVPIPDSPVKSEINIEIKGDSNSEINIKINVENNSDTQKDTSPQVDATMKIAHYVNNSQL